MCSFSVIFLFQHVVVDIKQPSAVLYFKTANLFSDLFIVEQQQILDRSSFKKTGQIVMSQMTSAILTTTVWFNTFVQVLV